MCIGRIKLGLRYDGAGFVVQVIKKTEVVNSQVFKCPCSAVVNYGNILCLAGLGRKTANKQPCECRLDACLDNEQSRSLS